MSFVNTQFLIYAVVAILVIAIFLNRFNANYFKWVKSYWFFERTWASRISSFLYILSLLLFMLALLDLRGPEKKIRASLPDQRTIIILDTSASMLSEDVRPSRFVKSLQIARHFVKNAPGHQVSVVLFSDIQKRLIPFTDDIDLIDSRLAALEKTNSIAGGSNISQAVEESVQYFEFDSSEDDKSKTGNILVFTDAEESEGEFKVKIPSSVNLAIVGVGTLKGGNIPLRWEDGSFRGYKTFKGEPVITKLDEEYIKKIGRNVQSFKYWIANSYSLPTEDIMNFFRSSYNKKQSVGDMRIRPVYSHYILIPAIVLFCLSVLVGRFPVFKMPKILMILFFLRLGVESHPLYAQEKKAEVSPEIKKDLELIKEGKADREYVLKTAEKMLKAKDDKRATELYSEYGKKDDSEEVRFNHATALLKSSRLKEALPIIQDLMKNSKNEDLKDKMRKNLRMHIEQKKKQEKEDQQKKEQEQKDKEEQKNNQDSQNQQDKKDGDDDKQNKGQSKPGSQGNQKEDGKNKEGQDQKDKQQAQQKPNPDGKLGEEKKEDNKDKKDGKDKDGKNKGQDGEEEKEKEEAQPSGPSTLDEKEKEIEKKRRMVKTPAMIKQIMSDDRELQKKMMDTSTSERGEQKPKRDW